MKDCGKMHKKFETLPRQSLEAISRLIEEDKEGQKRNVEIHIYEPMTILKKKKYYYFRTVLLKVKIPSNVQMIQCIMEWKKYWLHMSTSSNFTLSLEKYKKAIFDVSLTQFEYDAIRTKEKCSCYFCFFPIIVPKM